MSAIASTSVLPLSRRVAGPHRLPHLLSILPSAGRLALVRPTDGDPESFYLITRSHLRFTAKEVQEEKAKKKKQAITMGGGGNAEEKPKLKVVNVNPMDGGVIKAHGRAHGMLFRHGKYGAPSIRTKMPDPLIRGPVSQSWISIDPSTLPESTLQTVNSWKELYDQRCADRKRIFQERVEVNAEKKEKRRVERLEIMKLLKERRKEMMKVEIVY